MTFIPDQFAPNKWKRLFGFDLGEEARDEIRYLVGEYHENIDGEGMNDEGMNYAGMNDAGMDDAGMNDEGMDDDWMDDDWMDDECTANKHIDNKDISKLEKSINRFLSIIEKSVSDYHYISKGGGIDFNKIDKKETYKYLKDLDKSIDKLTLLICKLNKESGELGKKSSNPDKKHSELNRYMFRSWSDSNYSTVTKEGGKELYPPSIILDQLHNLKLLLKDIPEQVRKRGGDKDLDNVRPKGGRPSSNLYELGLPIYEYYMKTLKPYVLRPA